MNVVLVQIMKLCYYVKFLHSQKIKHLQLTVNFLQHWKMGRVRNKEMLAPWNYFNFIYVLCRYVLNGQASIV